MMRRMETKEKYGLYVHIPFCVSKCSYCNFASVPKNNELIKRYADALCKEMKMHKASFSDVVFDTIFIGGGTPSCIPKETLQKIIMSVYDNFETDIEEFTVEINPGTGDYELFSMLKDAGVNRASVGLQCANNDVLKSIGRIHSVDQFADTVNQIKKAGISNFSVDIISGLPGQNENDLLDSVNLADNLGANHISMYTLKLEDSTPLKLSVEKGEISLPDADYEFVMSQKASEHLENLGFIKYEISNYAKKGYESKHNLKYWKRLPYLGVGTAAASMYNDTRCCNTGSIAEYISKINNSEFPYTEKAKLSTDEISFEMIMLGTRLKEGMEYAKYNEFTGTDFMQKYSQILSDLTKEGLIEKSSTHLVLSQKGMNLQNNVLLRFMD